jgi:hypothetical protein
MWTYYFRVPCHRRRGEPDHGRGRHDPVRRVGDPRRRIYLIAQDPQGAPFALVGKRVEEVGA